jgi:hypothetical protein
MAILLARGENKVSTPLTGQPVLLIHPEAGTPILATIVSTIGSSNNVVTVDTESHVEDEWRFVVPFFDGDVPADVTTYCKPFPIEGKK